MSKSESIRGLRSDTFLKALDVAQKAVTAAAEKQAEDVVLLDLSESNTFADYFIICSGSSKRQLEAIGEEISSSLKKEGIYAHHAEGTAASGWVLLDFGSVIVHIFAPEKRQFYGLEELWGHAKLLVRVQ